MEVFLNKLAVRIFLTSLLFSGISIRLIGDVYLTEMILSVFALFSIVTGKKVFVYKGIRLFPLLFFLWFFANLFSSLVSGKTTVQVLIASFTVIITGLTVRSVLEFFLDFPNLILASLTLFSIGRIVGLLVQPQPYTAALPWKFGFGEWSILLGFLLFAKIKRKFILVVTVPLFLFFSFTGQARTLSFLIVGTLAISLIAHKSGVSLGLVLAISLLPFFVYIAYLDLALSGRLGENEVGRARILAESDLGPLAARKEFVFSTRAFVESPIIGRGFDPVVSEKILNSGAQELLSNGVRIDYAYLSELPMHSFLMSSLVQGGLFAGLFWLLLLVRTAQGIVNSTLLEYSLRPLTVYICLSLFDRILFSPYGALERLNVALFASYILIVNTKKRINV